MASEISNTMVENMASLYVAPYKDGLKWRWWKACTLAMIMKFKIASL